MKLYLCKRYADQKFICESRTALPELISAYEKLQEENEGLRGIINDIVFNTSTSMPAAWNDEKSWYESQLFGCIGRAARALKALDSGDK